MPDDITLVPIAEIWIDALPRDRTAVYNDQMLELRGSILRDGLRQPVELYRLQDDITGTSDDDDTENLRFGLISGYRRLSVFQALEADFPGKFSTIPALIRPFRSRAEALRHVIEENDLHAAINPWDMGHVLVESVRTAIHPSLDDAIRDLFPSAPPAKRTRLRAFAHVVDSLGDLMIFPQGLSQQKMIRLAAGLRDQWTDLIAEALRNTASDNPDRQWATLDRLLTEAEAELTDTNHVDPRPGRPRRSLQIRDGVRLRREKTALGYSLHFSGRMVDSPYMDDVIDQLEIWFGRRE